MRTSLGEIEEMVEVWLKLEVNCRFGSNYVGGVVDVESEIKAVDSRGNSQSFSIDQLWEYMLCLELQLRLNCYLAVQYLFDQVGEPIVFESSRH